MKEYTPKQMTEALDDFEHFLMSMDDVLEAFISQAANEHFILDYSLDSLNQVEQLAIKKDSAPGTDFHSQAAQYLGEVCRKQCQGKWELSVDMPNNSLYYGKPVVVKPGNTGIQFSPYIVVNSFLVRKRSGTLKKAVINYLTPVKLNLDHLSEK